MKPDTLETLITAAEQHKQAVQNFNCADSEYIDKAINEFSTTRYKLLAAIISIILEVRKS